MTKEENKTQKVILFFQFKNLRYYYKACDDNLFSAGKTM
jgi:hypothetical protein